jgi:hypothetical protein
MTKYLGLVLALLLTACGNNNSELNSGDLPPQRQTFTFEGQDWHITIPGDWEILPAERQVPFLARKGSANIAILERDLVNQDPVEQIISSAEEQFFTFTLEDRDNNTWQFTGQPGPTNTPRTFWQEIKTVSTARKFLLASCSEITDNSADSKCAAIINSWELVVEEENY